jgi:hypothetical protein
MESQRFDLRLDEWGIPLMEVRQYQDALSVATHGKIVVVTAPDGKSLSKPFLRIQETYEGRKYKGIQVSMNRFKKWYKSRHQDTAFTYYKDWLGFNFPGQAVVNFLNIYKANTNDAEKVLIAKLDFSKLEQQYVIGILQGDSETLLHEMCHALFYLDSDYRAQVLNYLNKMQYLDELKEIFSKTDYHNSVWLDEIHAHLISGIADIEVKGKRAVTDIEKFDQIVADLKKIFNEHVQKYPEIVALI